MVTSRSMQPLASAVALPITTPLNVTFTAAPGWNPQAWTWMRSPGRPTLVLSTSVAACLGAVDVVVVLHPEYGSQMAWAPAGSVGIQTPTSASNASTAPKPERARRPSLGVPAFRLSTTKPPGILEGIVPAAHGGALN